MNFLAASIESLGAKLVGWFTVGYGTFAFLTQASLLLLDRTTWNHATFDVVIKQVYFTAVQILHIFLGYSLVISWLIISIILSTARDFGLTAFASEMTIRVLVLELLPFLTALFIALRSGSAINTEVALMQVNNELDALAHCKVPPMQFEFLPRLIGGVVSVVILAGLAGLTALLLAYLSIYGMSTGRVRAVYSNDCKDFRFQDRGRPPRQVRPVRSGRHPDPGYRGARNAEKTLHGSGLSASRHDAGVLRHCGHRGGVISAQIHLTPHADRTALMTAVAALPDDVARVALDLPLRANLSALDNIALIPLYQRHYGVSESTRQAQAMLDQLGHADIALLRDPDMTPAQRFVAKLARALILKRPRLVIDRPGAMLYDVPYPAFIQQLAAQDNISGIWEIFDFSWNQVLYHQALHSE